MLRLGEYSPVLDARRFAAHEKFFVQDVRQRARSRSGAALPAERTAVCGVSASAELALAMGQGHPGIYGAVFCASPDRGCRPPAVMPSSLPRACLVAGTLEPFFLENATRWAVALREAGADVVMTERAGSHGDANWTEEPRKPPADGHHGPPHAHMVPSVAYRSTGRTCTRRMKVVFNAAAPRRTPSRRQGHQRPAAELRTSFAELRTVIAEHDENIQTQRAPKARSVLRRINRHCRQRRTRRNVMELCHDHRRELVIRPLMPLCDARLLMHPPSALPPAWAQLDARWARAAERDHCRAFKYDSDPAGRDALEELPEMLVKLP